MIAFSQVPGAPLQQWHVSVDRRYRVTIVRVGDGYGVCLDGEMLNECATLKEAQEMVRRVLD